MVEYATVNVNKETYKKFKRACQMNDMTIVGELTRMMETFLEEHA